MGVGNSEGEGDSEILLLFYSEIELAFQIINITMVFIRIPMFLMFECLLQFLFYVYVTCLCLRLYFIFTKLCSVQRIYVCVGGGVCNKMGGGS